MSGKIKKMIDTIMEQRAKGNATLMATTRTKLMLKGVNVDSYNDASADDPAVMDKLAAIAQEMNVKL